MLGQEVIIRHKWEQIIWTVINGWNPESPFLQDMQQLLGLLSFDMKDNMQDAVLCQLFLHIAFADWTVIVDRLDQAVSQHNESKKVDCCVHKFTQAEFLTGLGLLIGATEFGQKAKKLWVTCDKKADGEEVEDWKSMVPHPNFDQYMHLYHFKEFHHFLPEVWFDYNLKELNDPW